jgi:hypothetical protein
MASVLPKARTFEGRLERRTLLRGQAGICPLRNSGGRCETWQDLDNPAKNFDLEAAAKVNVGNERAKTATATHGGRPSFFYL